MILEVLLQSHVYHHQDRELNVVHCIVAGVRDEVFFNSFFLHACSQAGKGCCIDNSFNKLLVGHPYLLSQKISIHLSYVDSFGNPGERAWKVCLGFQ